MTNHALNGFNNEIDFVKFNNKNKNLTNSIWNFLISDTNLNIVLTNTFLIRVSKKVPSTIHSTKINPKSDIYLATGSIPEEYLLANDYFLDEKDIEKFSMTILNFSGISLKKPDSKNYQILKISPKPFAKIIGPYELGAGASVYCQKENEIYKNLELIIGWKSSLNSFKNYFSHIENINLIDDPTISNLEKLSIYKKIKTFSIKEIEAIVINDSKISNIVFKGESIFDEPYVAHYLVTHGIIKKNSSYDFSVTTGSGRSKGIYTLEFKPR